MLNNHKWKRGFTVVELVVSFALVMVVAYFLFNLLYSLKNLAVDSGLKTELLQKQALMVRELENDLENKKLVLATNCGKYCLDFLYDDSTSRRLELDTENNYFRYGKLAIKLLDGSSFGDIDVSNEQVITTGGGIKNDSMIHIKIPITNKLVEGDYGINIVYQYNSNEVSFNDLIFNTVSDNILYLKGSQDMIISTDEPYQEPGYFWLDSSGTQRTDGVTVSGSVGTEEGAYTLNYQVTYNGSTYTRTRKVTVQNKSYDFDFVRSAQIFEAPYKGTYKIELWGAQGGGTYGGAGAYTSGNITLNQGEKLYIYVGEHKNNGDVSAAFNGGGAALAESSVAGYSNRFHSGGGATDVRVSGGAWDNATSLRNRIMVAAGGGGGYSGTASQSAIYGGAGGAITGLSGRKSPSTAEDVEVATGGTQTAGGKAGTGTSSNGFDGAFGMGGTASKQFLSAGGGGYYGGGTSGASTLTVGSGAGGSSFISGYTGCNSVDSSGNPSGSANHYSGKVFTNGVMIDGTNLMPNARYGYETLGNEGNGYARITLVSIQN